MTHAEQGWGPSKGALSRNEISRTVERPQRTTHVERTGAYLYNTIRVAADSRQLAFDKRSLADVCRTLKGGQPPLVYKFDALAFNLSAKFHCPANAKFYARPISSFQLPSAQLIFRSLHEFYDINSRTNLIRRSPQVSENLIRAI